MGWARHGRRWASKLLLGPECYWGAWRSPRSCLSSRFCSLTASTPQPPAPSCPASPVEDAPRIPVPILLPYTVGSPKSQLLQPPIVRPKATGRPLVALFFGFTENLAHKREDAGLDHSACKQTFDHAQAGNEGTGRAKTHESWRLQLYQNRVNFFPITLAYLCNQEIYIFPGKNL